MSIIINTWLILLKKKTHKKNMFFIWITQNKWMNGIIKFYFLFFLFAHFNQTLHYFLCLNTCKKKNKYESRQCNLDNYTTIWIQRLYMYTILSQYFLYLVDMILDNIFTGYLIDLNTRLQIYFHEACIIQKEKIYPKRMAQVKLIKWSIF